MLDADLAVLYGVSTRRLNEQVRRNRDRFPGDFMFKLSSKEATHLKSRIATSSGGWGGRRKTPNAFTEHGAVMLASVLRSRVAVESSIQVVRAFVRLRSLVVTDAALAKRLDQLERKYDGQFKTVFEAIRRLMAPPEPPRTRIGFRAVGEEAKR